MWEAVRVPFLSRRALKLSLLDDFWGLREARRASPGGGLQGMTGAVEWQEEEEERHLSSSGSFLSSIFFLDLRPTSSTPKVKWKHHQTRPRHKYKANVSRSVHRFRTAETGRGGEDNKIKTKTTKRDKKAPPRGWIRDVGYWTTKRQTHSLVFGAIKRKQWF